jgi:hypothetical protein
MPEPDPEPVGDPPGEPGEPGDPPAGDEDEE